MLPTPVFLGFPCGSAGKESASNVGGLGSIPGLGRSPGEGNGHLVQCSGLENSTDSPWGCKELVTTERLSLSLPELDVDSASQGLLQEYRIENQKKLPECAGFLAQIQPQFIGKNTSWGWETTFPHE